MKYIVYDKLVPKGFGAITIGCLVFIREKHKDNESLKAHEAVHCKQFRKDWLMPIKYLLSKKHRFQYEVEAYAVSVKYGWPVAYAEQSLMKYNLGLTTREITKALRKELMK